MRHSSRPLVQHWQLLIIMDLYWVQMFMVGLRYVSILHQSGWIIQICLEITEWNDPLHGPLDIYVELRVAHALGMPGMFPPQTKRPVNDPVMHHGTCRNAKPRWLGKRSRHSRRMRNPHFLRIWQETHDISISTTPTNDTEETRWQMICTNTMVRTGNTRTKIDHIVIIIMWMIAQSSLRNDTFVRLKDLIDFFLTSL